MKLFGKLVTRFKPLTNLKNPDLMFYRVLDPFCVVRKSRFSNIREDTKEKLHIFVYFKRSDFMPGTNKILHIAAKYLKYKS